MATPDSFIFFKICFIANKDLDICTNVEINKVLVKWFRSNFIPKTF